MKWCGWFKKTQNNVTVENLSHREIIHRVLADPLKWAYAPGGTRFDWPETTSNGLYFPDSIFIKIGRTQIAYIHNVQINPRTQQVIIGHFAVARGFERKGIGKAVAFAFRKAVTQKYAIQKIIFSENSPHYDTSGYPQFFEAIGAKEILPTPPQIRSDWEW